LVEPIGLRFAPDLVLVSAGYDAHRADPLGGMRLTEQGFAALAGSVARIADASAGGRIGLFLEGGYDLAGLAGSLVATVEALGGRAFPTPPPPSAAGPAAAAKLRAVHGPRWGL
jgi:acetoin utilization deacetylase AcuC-like enzyme